MSRNVLRGGVQLPLGYIFEFDPTGITNAPDLSTSDKVHDYFGYGTWEAYGAGRTTIGVSSGHAIGSEGGEENHVLTTYEIPNHSHAVYVLASGWSDWGDDSMSEYEYWTTSWSNPKAYGGDPSHTAHVHMGKTNDCGSSQSHNNMQPYRTVYRWRRIA